VTFYAGSGGDPQYRTETENYRNNLVRRAVSVVALLQRRRPPVEIAAVTGAQQKGGFDQNRAQGIVEAADARSVRGYHCLDYIAETPSRATFEKAVSAIVRIRKRWHGVVQYGRAIVMTRIFSPMVPSQATRGYRQDQAIESENPLMILSRNFAYFSCAGRK